MYKAIGGIVVAVLATCGLATVMAKQWRMYKRSLARSQD